MSSIENPAASINAPQVSHDRPISTAHPGAAPVLRPALEGAIYSQNPALVDRPNDTVTVRNVADVVAGLARPQH